MDEKPLSGSINMGNMPSSGPEPAAPLPDTMSVSPNVSIPPSMPAEAGGAPQVPKSDQPFVVPPAAGNSANPFIPQVTLDPGQPLGDSQVSVPSAGNPMPKRILMVAVFLLLVVALIFGVRFAMSFMGSSQPVTLAYWGLWENEATVRSVLAGFEATHPKIKVVYTKQNPKQYRERLQAFIGKGDGPDVFRFHNTWVPMLRNELAPSPKNGITAAEFSSLFYPVASADLVGGQAVYGMPMMIDGLGLYYNEDLYAAAGVTPPTTWEEMLNIVPKLTVKNDTTILTSAIALGTTGNVEHFSDILATMVMQNGAKLSVPTGKEAEEALVFYKKFANPADPVYTWNDSMDNSIYAFATGKVAMIIAPSWRVFDIKQISPNIRFKVVPVPQLPGNTVTWASYWVEGVSAKSKNQEAAWQLVQYMASKETVTKMYSEAAKTRLFGELYARVDLGSTIIDDPYAGAYIKQAPTAKSFPLASRTFDNGINDKLIKYFEDAVNAVGQGTAPTAALETASNGFRQVLGSFGLTTGSAPTAAP